MINRPYSLAPLKNGDAVQVYSPSGSHFYGTVKPRKSHRGSGVIVTRWSAINANRVEIGLYPNKDKAILTVAAWGYDHVRREN